MRRGKEVSLVFYFLQFPIIRLPSHHSRFPIYARVRASQIWGVYQIWVSVFKGGLIFN